MRIIDVLGWYGMVAILVSFAALSFGYLHASDIVYKLLNLSGGFTLALEAYSKKDSPVVILNSLFALVALASLFRW